MKIARKLGVIAAGVVLSICILVLIGAQFFGLPFVSPVGSMVVSVYGPWLVLVPLALGIFAVMMWRASHSRGVLALIVMAIVATGWASACLAQIMMQCRQHGISIDLLQAFSVRVLPGSPPDDDRVYGIWQDQPLHLIVYKPVTKPAAASAPILMYIHGGGFSVGDRFESGGNLRWFADRGWLVLSIDYTLSSADRHLWDITTTQVGCAMAWAAAHAQEMGGDVDRLSLVGSSAGGNLAINAGYLANAGSLTSSCGGTVPHVAAVSALYPPVDLAAAWNSKVPMISDMARRFNTYYVGGSPEQYPDRYQFVDSAGHISATAPATLVIYGANDHLVPPGATDAFVEQARSAGIAMESVRFPYGEHAFNLNEFGIGNQFYLAMTERFLRVSARRLPESAPPVARGVR